jgi:hypothetical protein
MNSLSRVLVAIFIAWVVCSVVYAEDYNPSYWLQIESGRTQEVDKIKSVVDDAYARGYRGVRCWGSEREGATMIYYFKSPYLDKQSWAKSGGDRLSAYIKAAHEKGMKVIIDIQAVNPWHWKQNQWTPENIKAVVDDLAADGFDVINEECFEVKSDVFLALAREAKSKGVAYISGTDPMLLREANFVTLWPETGIINIYHYNIKRDRIFNVATLAEHGTLGYGWAKYWGKPISFVSPMDRDWGIACDYSPAVVPYMCMIRALEFRPNYFVMKSAGLDPIATQAWIKEYVDKQEKDRPLMDIVVLLKKQKDYSGSEKGDPGWNCLFNSGDAITSGAFNGGYNVIVSDKVVPADAYWVYATGGKGDTLPDDVVALFSTDKPVFIQCGSGIPSGSSISPSWKTVLEKCGIDGTKAFRYSREEEGASDVSLPEDQQEEIPYTGYYKDVYLRFTGSDVQRGMDLRGGTVIPKDAISGTVYCVPNRTYGRGPYIAGKDKKYVVTAAALSWEVAYPISNLLSGGGILPSSNVWGIVGKNVTALLAIETTELNVTIPGLADGSKIHVVVWDNKKNKKSEETVTYKAPYKHILKEYDFILIDAVK